MFIKSLKIENFRSISHLELKNLKKINILSGRNNCGKTTVLEALFLLIGMSNPQLPVNINNFRDLVLTEDEDFKYLFHNLNLDLNPEISGVFQDHERTLKLEPLFIQYPGSNIDESKKTKDDIISQASTNNLDVIDGLRLKASKDSKNVSISEIHLKRRIQTVDRKYKEQIQGSFLNPKTIFLDLVKNLETILIKKSMDKVITALKAIEPSLIDLRIGTGGMIYADLGLETLIPINLLGDGIRRILSILTGITEHKNLIALIDEIENGLYHSTLISLWEAILKAIDINNVQLFVATHSYECIHSFVKAIQALSSPGTDFALFRIERKGEIFKSYYYDADMLISGIENGIEVR